MIPVRGHLHYLFALAELGEFHRKPIGNPHVVFAVAVGVPGVHQLKLVGDCD